MIGGFTEVLQLLLASGGAEYFGADAAGDTAIHLAARDLEHGAASTELLLGAGAVTTVTDGSLSHPLHVAAEVLNAEFTCAALFLHPSKYASLLLTDTDTVSTQ